MSFGFGFALPAYPLRGGTGNNPFNQLGPTLDLSFVDGATNVGDLSNPNGYTLNTNFITPQYQVAAQYVVWETGVGLVDKTFSQIITFSRASGATWFNSAGNLIGVDFSTTSNTIGTGSKTFTLTATAGIDRSWATGDTVLISDQSNSSNNMTGTVTSYTASTQVLVVNVTSTGGSGTITSWRIGNLMQRLDYDPATLAAQGLLIEEQRTNSIRNNTAQGAVAGTPGTNPTNWSVTSSGSGLTREIVGVGTSNGITYVRVRYFGTATVTTFPQIYPEAVGALAASVGQTWSGSWFLRYPSAPTGSFGVVVETGESGGTTAVTTINPSITSSFQRFSVTRTLTDAATTSVWTRFVLTVSSGSTVDITIDLGLPQLENNNINTGVASATVSAGGSGYAVGDVLQIVGGTGSTAARLTVATLSGSAVATVTVSTAGSYSVFPSPQPVSVTAITGTGTSATFNIVPQTQTGFATSVIPTTTTALTRSADVASVNTLSPWYNATEGTLYVQAQDMSDAAHASNQPRAASLNDGTTSNRIDISRLPASAQSRAAVFAGGASQFNSLNTAWPLSTQAKIALAYKAADFAACLGGGAVASVASGTVPTVSALTIGNVTTGGSSQWVGWIQRLTYYPRRLSNAELVSITTP